ncbi:PREDICTED: uncharacterized protein LOC104594000 [Nelumbo nucifera]|uniref:Uncharacterized protein LOC104594000 n=1 Tax=Nelumbo nucifera TaxID=4432 RepID=A0A1U7ZL43_NELNU|nr:PREDICTED: uncharacterized protein LOC104594000 [Nelumbo nucifera]
MGAVWETWPIGHWWGNKGGEWKHHCMFSSPTQYADVVNSELKAAVFGVEKAKELGINRLIIEGDSKGVVNWLRKEEGAIWRLRNEFRCFKQASKDMEIHIRWIRRSVNSIADGLAKQGVERQSMFWATLWLVGYLLGPFGACL